MGWCAARDLTLHFADGNVDARVGDEIDSSRPLERTRKRSYIAPQPGLFDAPEEQDPC